jgi:hypothetical protein
MKTTKPSEPEKVDAYIKTLKHPLKDVVVSLRRIILEQEKSAKRLERAVETHGHVMTLRQIHDQLCEWLFSKPVPCRAILRANHCIEGRFLIMKCPISNSRCKLNAP